ncbi:L7Ae/L30e/S12e/Gadd45 family ribosomal protein [Rubeoparvulum massiliense]|uniref:L7Ae/L30e/S12e/Gadd45 family ribosomal protein n=1 Tax=Rubeoparvulum massiliense TaxID=1631346 RepID=UPI00065E373D|nr:ribosomal L7Ae/L30e/S12e/Gadd45 family protein [Rubeoparvulum massiliense]
MLEARDNESILQLLGLAQRARKVISGETVVLSALSSGDVQLVFLASDAGQSTKKRMEDKTTYYQIPLLVCFHRGELGRAIGKEERVVVAITDPGFAQAIRRKIHTGVSFNE